MKVIFLDIDGVLVCPAELKGVHTSIFINPDKLARLKRITELTGAKIVISSTWRIFTEPLEYLKNMMPILGCTPYGIRFPDMRIGQHASRGMEIRAWLDEHPDVVKYLIIDDDNDMLPEQMPFFINTRWDVGLQDEHIQQAVDILN